MDWSRVARQVLVFCVIVEMGFVILDYHINYGRLVEVGALRRMFNTAREDGLASWFGVTQTLLAGLTLWLIYLVTKAGESRWTPRGWLVVASFFTYMALDDGAQLHERLASTFDAWTDDSVSFFPSYTWQVLFSPLFAALGVFLLVFLWSQLQTTRLRAGLVTALFCLAVAVGLDFIEGLEPEHPLNAYTRIVEQAPQLDDWTEERFDHSGYEALRHFSKSIEEGLEMFANSLLWYLFLNHLSLVGSDFRVRGPSNH